jgi:hypothetical protein
MLVTNNYVGLVMRDLERMGRFYIEILGLMVNRRVVFPQIEIVYLGVTAHKAQVELLKPKQKGNRPASPICVLRWRISGAGALGSQGRGHRV